MRHEMKQLTLFLIVLLVLNESIKASGQIVLFLTSKDNLTELFIDGKEVDIPLHRPWNNPLEFKLHSHTRLLAVRSTAAFETRCPGLLGSIDSYFLTSNKTCKCTKSGGPTAGHLGFDDSKWNSSIAIGSNNGNVPNCPSMGRVPKINPNASWVWTEIGDEVVSYCRCYLPLCETRNPCLNKGTCLKNNPKLCSCLAGFTGTYCQLKTCETENPCQNKGKCRIENDTKICDCPTNYFGKFCEIPSCALVNPCKNNGTCVINNVKKCICPPYFFGDFCQIDKRDPCTKKPCLNNGICISPKPVNGSYSGEYRCNCPFAFTGRHCEVKVSSLDLKITAKEFLGAIYVDGVRLKPVQHDTIWNRTSPHNVPNHSRLMAIVASNIDNACAGIIASSSYEHLLSGAHWKCSHEARMGWSALGYDDSKWPQAFVTGKNDKTGITACKSGFVEGVSSKANWIWTNQSRDHDMVVYCRGYIDACKSRPCQNGGTCNKNFKTLCTCSPGYSGMFCDKVTFTSLKITAKEKLDTLYIDDRLQKIVNGNSWNLVDSFSLHPNTRLVALLSTDVNDLRPNCSGILSSVDLNWKCTSRATTGWFKLGFNDKEWIARKTFASNGEGGRCPDVTKPIPDISRDAKWFWTEPTHSLVSYCRGYFQICNSKPCHNGGICNSNLPKLCSCPPSFTGTFCEFQIGIDVPESV